MISWAWLQVLAPRTAIPCWNPTNRALGSSAGHRGRPGSCGFGEEGCQHGAGQGALRELAAAGTGRPQFKHGSPDRALGRAGGRALRAAASRGRPARVLSCRAAGGEPRGRLSAGAKPAPSPRAARVCLCLPALPQDVTSDYALGKVLGRGQFGERQERVGQAALV